MYHRVCDAWSMQRHTVTFPAAADCPGIGQYSFPVPLKVGSRVCLSVTYQDGIPANGCPSQHHTSTSSNFVYKANNVTTRPLSHDRDVKLLILRWLPGPSSPPPCFLPSFHNLPFHPPLENQLLICKFSYWILREGTMQLFDYGRPM